MAFSVLSLALLLPSLANSAPYIFPVRRAPRTDVLGGANFPDPTLINVGGTIYAFGTVDDAGHEVPVVSSPDFSNWSGISDAFAGTLPAWAAPGTTWAPDVNQLTDFDGSFAIYYSPGLASNPNIHCIGLARSGTPAGPYSDSSTQPLICPAEEGGAIDAAGFLDDDGTRYIVYKIDGPAVNGGGYCASPNNTPRTPILLQRVANNGYDLIGDPVQILDNNGVEDRYQTEAPVIIRSEEGVYFLFFSTGCYTDNSYTTSYATSVNGVQGPYEDRQVLIRNGDFGQFGPGGADILEDGSGRMVYHSLKADNDIADGRVMNTAVVSFSGRTATIN